MPLRIAPNIHTKKLTARNALHFVFHLALHNFHVLLHLNILTTASYVAFIHFRLNVFYLVGQKWRRNWIARGAETEHDFGTIMKNNCEPVHTARVIKLVTCTNLCLNAYNQNVWDQLVNCARRACQWQWVLKQVNARKWNSKWILRSRGADIINFRSLSCNPTSKTKKWKKKETRTAVVCMAGGAYSTQSIAQWVHSP